MTCNVAGYKTKRTRVHLPYHSWHRRASVPGSHAWPSALGSQLHPSPLFLRGMPTLSTPTLPAVSPTRPPVSSPSVAAKRRAWLVSGEL